MGGQGDDCVQIVRGCPEEGGHELSPHEDSVIWDGAPRGTAEMQQGAPQGSPLSPVLWLIQIAKVLHAADHTIKSHQHRHRWDLWHSTPLKFITRGHLFSYVDDVNPLIITRGTRAQHNLALEVANQALEEAAAAEGLRWDAAKETTLHFNAPRRA